MALGQGLAVPAGLGAPSPVGSPSLNNPTIPPGIVSQVGGVMAIPISQLLEEEKQRAMENQNTPIIQGLAGYVKTCFDASYSARQQTVDERLSQCIRQRRGEYDPEVLQAIQKSGGSAIYMMLTANKCRAASAWLRDMLRGAKDDRPWDVETTRIPDLSPDQMQEVAMRSAQEAMIAEQQLGFPVVTPERMKEFVMRVKDEMVAQTRDRADRILERMKRKMDDQLQEGDFDKAMDQFIEDLVTYPYAVIKGPVPRRLKQLRWKEMPPKPQLGGQTYIPAGSPDPVRGAPQQPAQGPNYELEVKEVIQLCWERVDPYLVYWAPHATNVNDGYLIERHKLLRSDLQELIGVEGYNDAAIRGVLDEYGKGGLHNWLTLDATQATAEGKSISSIYSNPEVTIDALQFWGSVQGKMLLEWGMDEQSVPDPLEEYQCEVWCIGSWVIKATLNPDPCGRKPYYKTSYEEIPGSWDGNGVCDLVRDTQSMCNAAARALSNNMGIASGPQSYVNVDRLPPGEDVTELYPWKIWQVNSDPYGSSAKPIEFFQPSSNAQELLGIYEKFSVLADEYSGVPRYMTGDSPAGGAGRTASGMSMLMQNAGKTIKQVIGNIDMNVIQPLIERLYYYNMKYSDDPELKGDVRVVAKGMTMLVAQENAQVRMNEVLNIVASNPMFVDIVGEEAIADLLREITKPLNLDIVPDKETVRAHIMQRQQMQMLMLAAQARNGGQPQSGGGQQQGPRTMPGNKQTLMNGAPITDNMQRPRR